MSSSPDRSVIRGAVAENATAARFATNLRMPEPNDPKQLEEERLQARTTGYAEGWAQGKRDALAAAEEAAARARAAEEHHEHRRAAALAHAVNALGRAVTELENQLMPTFTELQDLVLSSAFELAEAVIGRTLRDDPERGRDALRRAMTAAPEHGDVRVRLHPEDYAHLVGDDPGTFDYQGRQIHLHADPGLRPGDAIAETGTATVDATIEAAVARAREALRL
ncbi:flagellar assembly protein [Actinoplanes sp. SE50]|uniref:FliH/SctL family protein n=1 Tax=unclassified Actinoplanes TaxID=2626549 RepID=UPI00023EDEEB|nr:MULTISPECIES: FliH/SctL family protein [unclassified Actinoplanes]AEV88786.1 flagellar assembly protein FliH [Actinoplanes sp. SE50/110]ATO87192.1 flagellar assembly protein [Actinoplanes sp. SE50]SLM04610.1 flagellar assembly protein [Actinoplanes sp. SE50/110]